MLKARYWDSNVWLGMLSGEEDKREACQDQLERARQGEFKIVCSAITLTEVVWLRGPNKQKLPPEVNAKIVLFFKQPFIELRPVDRIIGEMARQMVWDFADMPDKLKPYDAVHVATAAFFNVEALHTYDNDLLQLDQLVQCSNGRMMEISKPSTGALVPLFSANVH